MASLGASRDIIIAVISSGEQFGQDKKLIVAWQVVCPEEALLFLFPDAVSFGPPYRDVIHQSCPSWIPRWLQGEWLRTKTDTEMKTEMSSFSPIFS
jgi:hypothetical protein